MKKCRKGKLGNAGRILAAALTLGLLVTGAPAQVQASGQGSLTVQLEEFALPSSMEGVRIAICKVGDVDVYGKPEFYEKYDITAYPVNSRETEEAIDKLLAAGALAEASLSGVTDAGGAAKFTGIPDGIYLGAAQEASRYGEISPFLIHTPYYYGAENGKPSGLSYDVTVHPKALPIKKPTPIPEQEPTPTPTATPTPGGATETPSPTPTQPTEETPGGTGGSSGGIMDKPGKESAPKTGDNTPVGLLLVLLCASGLTIGVVRSRRENV